MNSQRVKEIGEEIDIIELQLTLHQTQSQILSLEEEQKLQEKLLTLKKEEIKLGVDVPKGYLEPYNFGKQNIPRPKHDPPLKDENGYWQFAFQKTKKYPDDTNNSGKWLIFIESENVDTWWDCVKKLTEEGKLGGISKVSTAKPNPNSASDHHVICVFTYDYEDIEDIQRIRSELRKTGIRWKIPYKANKHTGSKYSNKGDNHFSIYYE